MNYQKHYNLLINCGRNRILEGYCEEHHIIPKCFFKSRGGHLDGDMNEPSNLVLLTPEEHYLAHQLLVKIYPNNHKIIKAASAMIIDYNGKRVNNKLFGWLKRKISEIQKGIPLVQRYGEDKANRMKNNLQGFILRFGLEQGTVEYEKYCKEISERLIGIKKSKEHRKNLSNFRTGKTNIELMGVEKAKEIREFHIEDGKSRIWITDGIISKHVKKDEPIPLGFFLGRGEDFYKTNLITVKNRPSRKNIPRTEETKSKLRKPKSAEGRANIGRGALKRAKKVICVETGIIYESASDASRKTGCLVDESARTGRKSKGYHWKYVEDIALIKD